MNARLTLPAAFLGVAAGPRLADADTRLHGDRPNK